MNSCAPSPPPVEGGWFFLSTILCYALSMDNITFDLNGVYNEIITRMEEEGAFDRTAYYDLVVEVLEEKRESGALTDDDDIEEMEDVLKKRWIEAEEAFTSGHDRNVIDSE